MVCSILVSWNGYRKVQPSSYQEDTPATSAIYSLKTTSAKIAFALKASFVRFSTPGASGNIESETTSITSFCTTLNQVLEAHSRYWQDTTMGTCHRCQLTQTAQMPPQQSDGGSQSQSSRNRISLESRTKAPCTDAPHESWRCPYAHNAQSSPASSVCPSAQICCTWQIAATSSHFDFGPRHERHEQEKASPSGGKSYFHSKIYYCQLFDWKIQFHFAHASINTGFPAHFFSPQLLMKGLSYLDILLYVFFCLS